MEPIVEVVGTIPVIGQAAPGILTMIVEGYYSDLFFDKWTPLIGQALKNNIALLLLFAVTWQKLSKRTTNTWDDKASNWLFNKLSGKTIKEGEEEGKKKKGLF